MWHKREEGKSEERKEKTNKTKGRREGGRGHSDRLLGARTGHSGAAALRWCLGNPSQQSFGRCRLLSYARVYFKSPGRSPVENHLRGQLTALGSILPERPGVHYRCRDVATASEDTAARNDSQVDTVF